MKIHVEFLNAEHTKARITITPGWLARLFGARPKSGEADRVAFTWVWATTLRHIKYEQYGVRILNALELQDVEKLPRAQLVERTFCACGDDAPSLPILELGKRGPVGRVCAVCGFRLRPTGFEGVGEGAAR